MLRIYNRFKFWLFESVFKFDPSKAFELNATHFKIEDDSLLVFELLESVTPEVYDRLVARITRTLRRVNKTARILVLSKNLKLSQVCKVPQFIMIEHFRDIGTDDRHFEYVKVSDINSFSNDGAGGAKLVLTVNNGLRTLWTEENAEEIQELIKGSLNREVQS